MFNNNQSNNNTNTNQYTWTNARISRIQIIAETEKSVLVEFTQDAKLWILKPQVRVSEFTLFAEVSIASEFNYTGADKKTYNGVTVIEYLSANTDFIKKSK